MKKYFFACLVLIGIKMGSKASAQSNLKLWYKQPAAKWTQALHIGNGTFGGMVFGGIDKEIIQLNDTSLWTGGPHKPITDTTTYTRHGW